MTEKEKINLENGIYEGEVKDGVPHGKGKSTLSDGSIYEGNFKDGFPHGKGMSTSSKG